MFNLIFIILSSFYNEHHLENSIIDVCDVIELNNYYNENGELTFKQFIFRKWSRQLRCHYIIDYRMQNDSNGNDKIGNPTKIGDLFILKWNDNGIIRKVISKRFITTHTDYDPEVKEKQYWHYLNRRELTR